MPSSAPRALLCALLVTTVSAAQGRSGVVISEVHHVSRGDGLPTYIELQNLDPFPSNPAGTDLSGGAIVIQGATGAAVFNFPPGTFIPAYAPTVNSVGAATPGTGTITLFDPGGPSIPGPVEAAIPASSLFALPGALDPSQPWTICLAVPGGAIGTGSTDSLQLNGGSGNCGAMGAPFIGPLTYQGGLVRGYRVDSNTFWDFIDLPPPGLVPPPDPPYQGPPVQPSPTVNNPEMARVSGFYFGTPTNNPEDGGIPFTAQPPPAVAAGATTGVVSNFTSFAGAANGSINVITPPGVVAWIEFAEHPYQFFRRQQDPIFDEVIPNGFLDMNMTMNGDDPFLGHAPAPTPTAPVANFQTWDLIVPNPMGPGILNIDMGILEQVDLGFQTFQSLAPATPAEQLLRVERVLTDFQTDAAASGTGNLTPVQIDILPPEGDLWCELIVYDGNGFSYRAKVRNWPPNPLSCTTPNLGLGSNAAGNIDVIATCFDPMSEIYVLPSMNQPTTVGTGPFFGLNPDSFTWFALGSPINTDPWHSETTVDGLYFWSYTDPSLTGMSVDAVAVQWGTTGPTGSGFTQWSPVARVTIQ